MPTDKDLYIDPHIHMVSRTTDDYEAMQAAGVVAVIEPAFWLGQPRTSAASFRDYFSQLVGWERFRAAQFGIRHYCCIGLNSKEANQERLADEVMEMLPLFACKEGVVAIGRDRDTTTCRTLRTGILGNNWTSLASLTCLLWSTHPIVTKSGEPP